MRLADISLSTLRRGSLSARLAITDGEVEAAQGLRFRAFASSRPSKSANGRDEDSFDAQSAHVLIQKDSRLLACYRLRLWHGAQVVNSYTAQFYDLSPLALFPKPMLELGRFCMDPDHHDPDVLRLAWAAMAYVVDTSNVGLLFGCTSFVGADPRRHAAAMALLKNRIGPKQWRPLPKSDNRIDFANLAIPLNGSQALMAMPTLMRSYLGLGGWVSDHAVLDQSMDTLHVFTGVEIDQIPPGRARSLRAIAGNIDGVK